MEKLILFFLILNFIFLFTVVNSLNDLRPKLDKLIKTAYSLEEKVKRLAPVLFSIDTKATSLVKESKQLSNDFTTVKNTLSYL